MVLIRLVRVNGPVLLQKNIKILWCWLRRMVLVMFGMWQLMARDIIWELVIMSLSIY